MKFSDGHGSVTVEIVDGQGLITALEGDGAASLPAIAQQVRAWLKGQGCSVVFAHVDITDTRLIEIYEKRWGMEPKALILRTEV